MSECEHEWVVWDLADKIADAQMRTCSRCGMKMARFLPPWVPMPRWETMQDELDRRAGE